MSTHLFFVIFAAVVKNGCVDEFLAHVFFFDHMVKTCLEETIFHKSWQGYIKIEAFLREAY